MSQNFDLSLLPAARFAGSERPDLLGLYYAEPPRRAVRGRESDRLILYLAFASNEILTASQQEDLLAGLAKLYYETQGSVTSAMRAVAQALNRSLLERNQRAADNQQVFALLAQVVGRADRLFVAQSGPFEIFWVTGAETKHLSDPEQADRCLGQSRSAPIHYIQSTLHVNDTIVIAALPSPQWNEHNLSGLHGLGPESLRRRLFAQSTFDVNAILIQAHPGAGKFYLHRLQAARPLPTRTASDTGRRVSPPLRNVLPNLSVPEPLISSVEPALQMTTPAPESLAEEEPWSLYPSPGDQEVAAPESIANVTGEDSQPAAISTGANVPSGETHPLESSPRQAPSPVRAGLTSFGNASLNLFRKAGQGLRRLLVRILPDESWVALPSSVMAITALALPVIIVTIATYTYFQLGSAAQYENLIAQAQEVAARAAGRTNVLEQRQDLLEVLAILDQAQVYKRNQDMDAMRAQVVSALDAVDRVRRIDYRPAIIGGLSASVNIINLTVSDRDLYLLDEVSGGVIRAQYTEQGYQLDYAFQCSPAAAGLALGALVDLVSWPGEYKLKASVLGVDEKGNLLYCAPNQQATRASLADPPNGQWNKIVAFTQDPSTGDFYVLDPPSNGVWVFWRGTFSESPTFYFSEEVPILQDVIDIEVNRGDLYLLHEDGRLTFCTYTSLGVAPTRCSDVPYTDARPGREDAILTPPNPFTLLQVTQPPDPSIFFLESKNRSLYHFSLRNLVFQQEYLSANSLPSRPATAFTIDSLARNVFLAVGYEVFYGPLP